MLAGNKVRLALLTAACGCAITQAAMSAAPMRVDAAIRAGESGLLRVADKPTYVWQLGEQPGESAWLGVVDANDESGEGLSAFSMTCSHNRPWKVLVEDIDAAAIGRAFSKDGTVELRISDTENPKPDGDEPRLIPDIAYGGEMYGNWDFSIALTLDMLDDFAKLPKISVVGTGVDRTLPTKDMKASLAKFRKICSAFGDGSDSSE